MQQTRPLQFGISIPQIFLDSRIDPGAITAYVQKAEAMGYHSLWVQDRTLGPISVLESVTLLTFAAAVTRTIRLGVSVIVLPIQNPVHLAKRLSTLDQLSGGRLIAGVGIGENRRIYPAFGITPDRRAARYGEAIRVMKLLWTENRVTFHGQFTRLEDAAMEPKPLQKPHPPLWFGARAREALERAVELGDGWMGAGSSTLEDFERQADALRGILAAAKRDPGTFAFSKRLYIAVESDKTRALERLREWFGRYYGKPEMADRMGVACDVEEGIAVLRRVRAGGAEHILLNPVYDEERHMDVFTKEIIPALS